MAHKKISPNIYHDDRCTKMPYFVNITRSGHQFYKKFSSEEECITARQEFIEKHTLKSTDHPLVFIKNGVYILEAVVYKEFDDYESAQKQANIILRFTG